MSRSYKDGRGGHSRRDQPLNKGGRRWASGWTTGFKRFAKRHNRRLDRRNNKPDTRCPELIYPYLNKTSWYIKGSYIAFDFNDDEDFDCDDDWDMLDAHWAEEYDDYTGPIDDYEDPWDDYDPWDYDYDY
jgi:hypothetical protein